MKSPLFTSLHKFESLLQEIKAVRGTKLSADLKAAKQGEKEETYTKAGEEYVSPGRASEFASMIHVETKARKNASAFSAKLIPTTGSVHEFLRELFETEIATRKNSPLESVETVINNIELNFCTVINKRTKEVTKPASKEELTTKVLDCVSKSVERLVKTTSIGNVTALPLSLIYLALGYLLTDEQLEDGLTNPRVQEILEIAESRNRETQTLNRLAGKEVKTQIDMLHSFSVFKSSELAKCFVKLRDVMLVQPDDFTNKDMASVDLYKSFTSPVLTTSDEEAIASNIFLSMVETAFGPAALASYELDSVAVAKLFRDKRATELGQKLKTRPEKKYNPKKTSLSEIDYLLADRRADDLGISVYSNSAREIHNQIEDGLAGSKYLHPAPVHENAKRKLAREFAASREKQIDIEKACSSTERDILAEFSKPKFLGNDSLRKNIGDLVAKSGIKSFRTKQVREGEAKRKIDGLLGSISATISDHFQLESQKGLSSLLLNNISKHLNKLLDIYVKALQQSKITVQSSPLFTAMPEEAQDNFVNIVLNANQNEAVKFMDTYAEQKISEEAYSKYLKPILESLTKFSEEDANFLRNCLTSINNVSSSSTLTRLLNSLYFTRAKLRDIFATSESSGNEEAQEDLEESISTLISALSEAAEPVSSNEIFNAFEKLKATEKETKGKATPDPVLINTISTNGQVSLDFALIRLSNNKEIPESLLTKIAEFPRRAATLAKEYPREKINQIPESLLLSISSDPRSSFEYVENLAVRDVPLPLQTSELDAESDSPKIRILKTIVRNADTYRATLGEEERANIEAEERKKEASKKRAETRKNKGVLTGSPSGAEYIPFFNPQKQPITVARLVTYIKDYIVIPLKQDQEFEKSHKEVLNNFSEQLNAKIADPSALDASITSVIEAIEESASLESRTESYETGTEALELLIAMRKRIIGTADNPYFDFLFGNLTTATKKEAKTGALTQRISALITEREKLSRAAAGIKLKKEEKIQEIQAIIDKGLETTEVSSIIDKLLSKNPFGSTKGGQGDASFMLEITNNLRKLKELGATLAEVLETPASSKVRAKDIEVRINDISDKLLKINAAKFNALGYSTPDYIKEVEDLTADALSGKMTAEYLKKKRKTKQRVYTYPMPGIFDAPVDIKTGILRLYSNVANINTSTVELLLFVKNLLRSTPNFLDLLKEAKHDTNAFESIKKILEPTIRLFYSDLSITPPEKTKEGSTVAGIIYKTTADRLLHKLIDLNDADEMVKRPAVMVDPMYLIPFGVTSCSLINLGAAISNFIDSSDFTLTTYTQKSNILSAGFMENMASVSAMPPLIMSDPKSIAALHYTVFSVLAREIMIATDLYTPQVVKEILANSFITGLPGEDPTLSSIETALNSVIKEVRHDAMNVTAFCAYLESFLLQDPEKKIARTKLRFFDTSSTELTADSMIEVSREEVSLKSPEDIKAYGKKLLGSFGNFISNILIKTIIDDEKNVHEIFGNTLAVLFGAVNHDYISNLYDALKMSDNASVAPVDLGVFTKLLGDNSIYDSPEVDHNKLISYLVSVVNEKIDKDAVLNRIFTFTKTEDSEEQRERKIADPVGTARTASPDYILELLSFYFWGADSHASVNEAAKTNNNQMEKRQELPAGAAPVVTPGDLSIQERGKIVIQKAKHAAEVSKSLNLMQIDLSVLPELPSSATGVRATSTTTKTPTLSVAYTPTKTYTEKLRLLVRQLDIINNLILKFNPEMEEDLTRFKSNCKILAAALGTWSTGVNQKGMRDTIIVQDRVKAAMSQIQPVSAAIFDAKKTGFDLYGPQVSTYDTDVLESHPMLPLDVDTYAICYKALAKEGVTLASLVDEMVLAFTTSRGIEATNKHPYVQVIEKLIASGDIQNSQAGALKLKLNELIRYNVIPYAIAKGIPKELRNALANMRSAGLLFAIKRDDGVKQWVPIRFFNFTDIAGMMSNLAPESSEEEVEETFKNAPPKKELS